jgi:hypothetical protein
VDHSASPAGCQPADGIHQERREWVEGRALSHSRGIREGPSTEAGGKLLEECLPVKLALAKSELSRLNRHGLAPPH